MSVITECLVADSVALSATAISHITPPFVETAFVATPEIVVQRFWGFLSATTALSATTLAGKRINNLEVPYTFTASVVTNSVQAVNFIEAPVLTLRSDLFSLIPEHLTTVTTAMSITVLQRGVLSLVIAPPVALTAAPVPGAVLGNLALSNFVLSAEILRTFKQLVVAPSLTLAATALTSARLTNLATVPLVLTSNVLPKLYAKNLVIAPAMALDTSVVTNSLQATSLIEADELLLEATTLDANGTIAWTAPTEIFAMSRYAFGFDFNSLATVGDSVFMFHQGGGYRRAPGDDIGSPINAFVRTDLMDFGDEYLKRGDKAYAAYMSTGGVQLDVGETRTGVEVTWSYALPVRPVVVAPSAGRFVIGRGIESRYLRFTIRNVPNATNGDASSTVNLRGMLIDYLRMSRKV